MASATRKHSLTVAGHRTSVSLEPAFWEAFREIARRERLSVAELARRVDAGRQGNLSSAIRLFVLDYYRARAELAAPCGRAGRGEVGV